MKTNNLVIVPPQTALDCMCCHHLQSRQSQAGCYWCCRSPGATSGPGSSVWCHGGFVGPWRPHVPCSSSASPRLGGCSWVLSPGADGWPECSSSGNPPPGSSAGWARGAKCWPDVSALPSALGGCKWEWWGGLWAGHQTRVEADCRHTQYAPPQRCLGSEVNRSPWKQRCSWIWWNPPVCHLARREHDHRLCQVQRIHLGYRDIHPNLTMCHFTTILRWEHANTQRLCY